MKEEGKEGMGPVRALVNQQAEDEGLWFEAQTAPEAYLQAELRKLHAVIEAEGPNPLPLPSLDLEAIEARCNAATPGPWEIAGHDGERHGIQGPRGFAEIEGVLCPLQSQLEVFGAGDAEFIAHARQDIPALIAEVRRLREKGAGA